MTTNVLLCGKLTLQRVLSKNQFVRTWLMDSHKTNFHANLINLFDLGNFASWVVAMCNCNYPPLLLVDKLVRRLLRPVGLLKSTLTFESKLLKLPPFLIDFNHVLETCAVLYTMPMSPVICAIFTYMSIYLDGRANTFPKEVGSR